MAEEGDMAGYSIVADGSREFAVATMAGRRMGQFVLRPPLGEWLPQGAPGESPLVGLLNALADDELPKWADLWGQPWPLPQDQYEPLMDAMGMVAEVGRSMGAPDDGASEEERYAWVEHVKDALVEAMPAVAEDVTNLALDLDTFPVHLMQGEDHAALRLDWLAVSGALTDRAFWCLLADPFVTEYPALESLRALLSALSVDEDDFRHLTAPQRFALLPDSFQLYCLSLRAATLPRRMFGGSKIGYGRAGDDAARLARLAGITEAVVTDSLPALVWRELVWAIRGDLRLRVCLRPTCRRYFLSPGGKGEFCATHTVAAPKSLPPAQRAAWKRYVQRGGTMDFATWQKGYEGRRRGRRDAPKQPDYR